MAEIQGASLNGKALFDTSSEANFADLTKLANTSWCLYLFSFELFGQPRSYTATTSVKIAIKAVERLFFCCMNKSAVAYN